MAEAAIENLRSSVGGAAPGTREKTPLSYLGGEVKYFIALAGTLIGCYSGCRMMHRAMGLPNNFSSTGIHIDIETPNIQEKFPDIQLNVPDGASGYLRSERNYDAVVDVLGEMLNPEESSYFPQVFVDPQAVFQSVEVEEVKSGTRVKSTVEYEKGEKTESFKDREMTDDPMSTKVTLTYAYEAEPDGYKVLFEKIEPFFMGNGGADLYANLETDPVTKGLIQKFMRTAGDEGEEAETTYVIKNAVKGEDFGLLTLEYTATSKLLRYRYRIDGEIREVMITLSEDEFGQLLPLFVGYVGVEDCEIDVGG
jgi:hypothetical protein